MPPSFATAAMSQEPEIMESQVMWEPDTKRNTHMDRFRAAAASSCGLRLGERRAGAGGQRPGGEAPLALPGAVVRLWGLAGLCFPGACLSVALRQGCGPSACPYPGEGSG